MTTTYRLIIVLLAALLGFSVAQPVLAQNQQALNRAEIDALKFQHIASLASGIALPPPTDKAAEIAEYGGNIALKFTPASITAPDTVVVRPNVVDPATGELCSFRYLASEHDLDPVFDYEDIYGATLDLPTNWGRLDDGATVMSNSSVPEFYHYNTGMFVTVRRTIYRDVADPEPWYPEQTRREIAGEQILFTDTNDIGDVVDGIFIADPFEQFPLGVNALSWEAENKLDFIFDVLFQPLIFIPEYKFYSRAAAKTRRTQRFARNWGDIAKAWRRSIDIEFLQKLVIKGTGQLTGFGLQISANEIENATDEQLLSMRTGTISRARQNLWVLDEVAPEIRLSSQPAPFEANMLGGERGNRHFDELRDLLQVRDNCNLPVILDAEPRGNRFWPVNQTTTLQWCARDFGPTSAAGGRNESCVDIFVEVEDTRPPLLLTPPAVSLISTADTNSVDIGWAGVFDVADPDVRIENDAPADFPIGRTPVVWTATDASGNATTGTQWINVKENNLPPKAVAQTGVSARTSEETRIDLQAFEEEPTFDDRYDQLSFRIEDAPQNGFFVAPLFPFFIDDHRTHRINPDGSYDSYFSDSRAACEATGAQPDPSVIYQPNYVSVNDDGVMYVLDIYLTCQGSGGNRNVTSEARVARFVPDENGELEFANQWRYSENLPGLNDADLFIDNQGRIWAIPPISTQIVVLAPDLTELQRIDFNQLSKIDPLNGDVTNAFNDANERPISVSVTQDDILYITTGAEVFSYDLMRRQPDNTNLFLRLPPIVQNPNFNEVDTATTEPWASYNKFLGGKYVDMVVDSSGDLYISDPSESRIWKFQGVRLNADRSLQQPPSFVGWAGRCDANLDPSVLACDTTLETSIGFSCEDDLCGASINVGSARGQFFGVRGIAMSPQDVLYATDTRNSRVQRFTTDGEFAGEAVSECGGSCFVLGDFGFVTNVAVNSNNFYLLDQDNDLTHIYETTPITDIDDQTMSQTQTAFVTYKSNEGYTGPDSFSFIAYDGLAYSDEAAVDINVTRNFRPPIATPGLTVAGLEDAPLPLPLSGLDRDGDTLDFAVDTPPANGTVTRGANGLVYTPNENFFGEDTFTYVATDAPTSVPAMTSAPELVTVVVAPVNDVPVLSAEPLDVQPFVYESRIEALLRDVDLDDRHRIAIDWGDGSISDSLSDAISLGRDNGIVRILADHSFTQTTNPGSPSTVTICASDVPSTARLTCASSDVTATLQLPVTVERLVDLRVDIDDSLPKTSDPDVPEIQISDPLLDGGEPVTYTVEIQNFIPSQSDFRPSATDVTAMLQVPNEMTLLSVVTPDGNCTSSGRQIDCNFGDISPDAAVVVDVTAVGSGTLIDDADATLQVEVFAAEANVGEDNAGSWLTELKLNGDLDADGDGVPNRDDAFPGDPTETADNDADGIGDNADLDDDNDTLPDGWEDRFGLDRLDPADRAGDLDADGLTNETEFAMGTRPDQVDSDRDAVGDAADNCPLLFNGQQFDANGDGRGDPCDPISYVGAVDVGDVDGDGEADVTLVTAMLNNTAAVTKSAATDFDIVAFTQVSGNPAPQAALPLRLSNDEVAVATPIRRSDGVLGGRTVNGWTGELVQQYSAFTQSFSFVAADVARSSSAEDALVILAESETSSIRADRRPASAATKDGDMTFFAGRPRFKPLGFAMIDYDVAVVLAHDNGNLVVQAREFGADSASNSTVGEWPIPSADWLDARVGALDDGFVVLTTNVDGSSTVSRWRLSDNASVLTFDLAAGEGTTVAISTGAGGPPMLRVVAADAAGDVTLLTYDLITGLQIQSTDVIDNLREVRAGLNQLPGRYGVLASDRTGAVTLELKDTLTGNTVTTLTAESMSPAPPPPPPPPPPPTTPPPGNSGGGGGGGAVGGWIVFTFAGLVAATHRRRRAIAARNN